MIAENPSTGCDGSGNVIPLAEATAAPDGGPSASVSTGRTARPTSRGSPPWSSLSSPSANAGKAGIAGNEANTVSATTSRMKMNLERISMSSLCRVGLAGNCQLRKAARSAVSPPPVIVNVPASHMHRAGVLTRTRARSRDSPGHRPGTDRDSRTIRPGHRPAYDQIWTGGMRMEQFDHRSRSAPPDRSRVWIPCAIAVVCRDRRRDRAAGVPRREPRSGAGRSELVVGDVVLCRPHLLGGGGGARRPIVAAQPRRRLPRRRRFGHRVRGRHPVPGLPVDRRSPSTGAGVRRAR